MRNGWISGRVSEGGREEDCQSLSLSLSRSSLSLLTGAGLGLRALLAIATGAGWLVKRVFPKVL